VRARASLPLPASGERRTSGEIAALVF